MAKKPSGPINRHKLMAMGKAIKPGTNVVRIPGQKKA